MTPFVVIVLLASAMLAAVGQVLFKLGADIIATSGFLNPWLGIGLICYGLSTVLWILALARAPLTTVYPFTALTLAMVYAAGIFLLDEPIEIQRLIGVAFILIGLYFIVST